MHLLHLVFLPIVVDLVEYLYVQLGIGFGRRRNKISRFIIFSDVLVEFREDAAFLEH